MKTFLVNVGDDDFSRVLPSELDRRGGQRAGEDHGLPAAGDPNLAPVLRQSGHQVRMFDTAHPQMKAEDIARRPPRNAST
jgi:hypothetical protein